MRYIQSVNIKPSNHSVPKYPALAALAVAVAVSTAACQQPPQRTGGKVPPQPQRTAGVPLATPEQQERLRVQREAARKQGEADRRVQELLEERRKPKQPRDPQRLGGKRAPVSELSESARRLFQEQGISGVIADPSYERNKQPETKKKP